MSLHQKMWIPHCTKKIYIALGSTMFSSSSIFIIQKWHQNGCNGWSWPLPGLLQLHGILPSAGHPGQDFPLLPEHRHQLLLLLGNQEQGAGSWTCAEKEGKPFNAEEKCQAENRIPQQEEASPFHCGLLSGCWLLILLWALWIHKLLWKGDDQDPRARPLACPSWSVPWRGQRVL